jgi:uncharacterized protein (DUF427 family)
VARAATAAGVPVGVRVRDVLMSRLGELRWEPTAKRVRAELGGRTVLDSTGAVLVWEPRRVVPSYGVPAADISAELVGGPAAAPADESVGLWLPEVSRRPILDPSIPFDMHTADGEVLRLRAGDASVAALRLVDGDLHDVVVVDFDGVDAWYEEDERIVGHPRDPFHRIDVLPSSRHVRLELNGQVLAESSRPVLLFETLLPTRFYLPREDVRCELRPSATRTYCAYKGQASYWSAVLDGTVVADLAWSYPDPLLDAEPVGGLMAFFDERIDLVVDGVGRDRPVTPWSPPGS